MKKLFVSILALAAFAACQSNFDDVTANTPGMGEQVVPEGMVRIYAEVGVGEEDTKATYGDDFSALWEENDQIALLQESANYGEAFTTVNKLNIKSGAGTSKAAFNGDITVPTESPRRYHIAYPVAAVSFETNTSLNVVVESDNYHESTWQMGQYSATGYGVYTYNSTLNITIPADQSGKWEPYMYASTEEAVNSNAIGAKTLTTLTGAIAVRAYKPNADGTKTPLQLKAIAVTASKPIAGTFSGTAQSEGRTATITGEKSEGNKSNVLNKDEMIADARGKLTTALQAYTATSTTVTNALSLSFTGNEYTVGAKDTEWVAADNDGNYTYYLNVAPFENADLTIMATAIDGSTLIRSVSAQTLVASQRKGYNFTWEDATLSVGGIESWYDDYAKSNFELAANTLYVRNLEVKGVSADQVVTLGVVVNGELHEATATSGVLTIDKIEISGLANGKYTAKGYAKVIVNGEERELIGSLATKNVTSIPTLTSYSVLSSYSKDGKVEKNNSIDGHLLKVTASLSDDYFVNNGLATIEVYNYNDDNKLGDIVNGEYSKPNAALGQYGCYVKISFTNGYLITSDEYETHVTGIPYSVSFDGISSLPANWSGNNVKYTGRTGDGNEVLRLYGDKTSSKSGWIRSPQYGIPTNVDVKVFVEWYVYSAGSLWPSSSTGYLYVNASGSSVSFPETNGKSQENAVFYHSAGASYTKSEYGVTLAASSPYVAITSKFSTNSPTYKYIPVKSFKVEYEYK